MSELDDAARRDRLAVLLSAARAQIPREPTGEMMRAGEACDAKAKRIAGLGMGAPVSDIWRAMYDAALSTAPKPQPIAESSSTAALREDVEDAIRCERGCWQCKLRLRRALAKAESCSSVQQEAVGGAQAELIAALIAAIDSWTRRNGPLFDVEVEEPAHLLMRCRAALVAK